MVSLRPFERNAGVAYGQTIHPAPLPAKQAVKLARMQRAVEYLITAPKPNVAGLAEQLDISRASVYRMLAESVFQNLLRQAVDGRVSMVARKALDTVEEILEQGSNTLRLRAACWLLERVDRLRQACGDPLSTSAEARARIQEAIDQLSAHRGEGDFGSGPVELEPRSQPGNVLPPLFGSHGANDNNDEPHADATALAQD